MTAGHTFNRWSTWREIQAQPGIWAEWAQEFDAAAMRAWIVGLNMDDIWFCGAGTSAYIGDIIVAGLEGAPGPRLRSVPTTDLVSRPHAFLADRLPLVINFGRSGNSSETLGTLAALDALCPQAPRLNITCNRDGALAACPATANQRTLCLPDATNDAGFAMTSSFSTMLLTGLALFDPSGDIDRLPDIGNALAAILPRYLDFAQKQPLPRRIVFTGTGALAFAAREAALKVMELTAGRIPALWDSTLGFRHGPKSFVSEATDIVVFTSSDPHAARYDADLVAELRGQFPTARVTAIGAGGDLEFPMPYGDAWAAPLAVALAQVLGVVWSDRLGLNVDDPFKESGTLTRVVSGVRLYEVTP